MKAIATSPLGQWRKMDARFGAWAGSLAMKVLSSDRSGCAIGAAVKTRLSSVLQRTDLALLKIALPLHAAVSEQ